MGKEIEMKNIRTNEYWHSSEGQSFLRSHLPDVYRLDQISNWAVFGAITFLTPSLRTAKTTSELDRQIQSFLNGVGARFNVRTKNLVFFYSVEGDGIHRYRHGHLLLANDRLENVNPTELCKVMTELAREFEIGNCLFKRIRVTNPV